MPTEEIRDFEVPEAECIAAIKTHEVRALKEKYKGKGSGKNGRILDIDFPMRLLPDLDIAEAYERKEHPERYTVAAHNWAWHKANNAAMMAEIVRLRTALEKAGLPVPK